MTERFDSMTNLASTIVRRALRGRHVVDPVHVHVDCDSGDGVYGICVARKSRGVAHVAIRTFTNEELREASYESASYQLISARVHECLRELFPDPFPVFRISTRPSRRRLDAAPRLVHWRKAPPERYVVRIDRSDPRRLQPSEAPVVVRGRAREEVRSHWPAPFDSILD